jgi:opacity protein-like surface antigen
MRISRIVRIVFIAAFGLCTALPAAAQYIGVFQSAETMDRGTFKLMLAPLMVFGKNGIDNGTALTVRGGYAFTDRFDAEVKMGFFENGTLIGMDGELWIMRGPNRESGVDLSLTGGLHWMFGSHERYDTIGLELMPQLSGHVSKNLELYGALSFNFQKNNDAPSGIKDTFTLAHFVPGIEYRLSNIFDLVAEFGIGINDNSSNYAGAGISLYFH